MAARVVLSSRFGTAVVRRIFDASFFDGLIQYWRVFRMIQYLVSLIRSDERGQGLAEYALILALIAVLAIAALIFLGGQINQILSDVGKAI